MRITFTSRHVEISEAVRKYAEEKLVHLLSKHESARVTKAHIIIEVQKLQHVIEIELHSPLTEIYGKAHSKDMYTSIDKVIDKIERQLAKLKLKYDKRKRGGKKTVRAIEES